MKYQKKDPAHVREVRMQAIARMHAALAEKKRQEAENPKEKAPSRVRTPQERGITTIQIDAEDARILAEMAKAKGVSRRVFLHGLIMALAPNEKN